jgi:hypothetical protein
MRAKAELIGPVPIEVGPGAGTVRLGPVVVRKRHRRLDRVYPVPLAVAMLAFKEGVLIMTERGARSLGRGELEPLADLIELLGLTGHFSGDAVMHGNDPVIRSPHRLGEASCTAQLLIGTAGAAIWEARGGTHTDISMDIIHALHYLHQTHYVEQAGYLSSVGAEFVEVNGIFPTSDGRYIMLEAGPP